MKKEAVIKMLKNFVFFILLIAATFWFIFRKQDMNQLYYTIISADKRFILIALIMMIIYYLFESYNIRAILIALGDKKISIFSGLKYTLIGFFFSAITPAATGGQPIEIYYMNKDKISGANSTMALLIQLCGFQISTISIGIICAIFNMEILKNGLIWFFLLGLLINGVALTIMLICVFSKNTSKTFLGMIIKILKALKVKNVDLKQAKLEKGLEQYTESSVFIRQHKLEFIKAIFRVFIQILIYFSIPYFVYRSFGLNDLNILQILSMQSVLYTTVSGLPLPGSIGVSETVFLTIFGIAFNETLLSGAMLLTRGVTFYFYVVISLIVVIINAVVTRDTESEIDIRAKEIDKQIKNLKHKITKTL